MNDHEHHMKENTLFCEQTKTIVGHFCLQPGEQIPSGSQRQGQPVSVPKPVLTAASRSCTAALYAQMRQIASTN